MKTQTLVTAMAAATLVGCAQWSPIPIGGAQPIQEEVVLEGNTIKPKSAVLVVPAGRSTATLEWKLPKGDATFPADGIVIEGAVVFPSQTEREVKGEVKATQRAAEPLRIEPRDRSNFNCTRSEDRLRFSCTSEKLVPGIYKYTIRVQRGSEVFKIDPPISIMGSRPN